jgi:hypothetical protein
MLQRKRELQDHLKYTEEAHESEARRPKPGEHRVESL